MKNGEYIEENYTRLIHSLHLDERLSNKLKGGAVLTFDVRATASQNGNYFAFTRTHQACMHVKHILLHFSGTDPMKIA